MTAPKGVDLSFRRKFDTEGLAARKEALANKESKGFFELSKVYRVRVGAVLMVQRRKRRRLMGQRLR